MGAEQVVGPGHGDPLAPYVARVALEWLASDPQARSRTVDGTVVFADVSGFTPLTEKLARQGKVGSEELTDVLNDVFGRLLRVADSHGGDLVKFGGDALLLLFTGEDHVRRAAAGAAGLLEALKPFKRFRTGGGWVALSMSIGVESGPVHLLLVGETHRELFAVGPVVSATVGLENQAVGGQVLVGPTAAAVLGDDFVQPVDQGAWLLRRPPVLLGFRSPAAAAGSAADGVPPMLRAHLSAGREDGEHRVASLAFLQIRGTDALLAASGLDAVAAAMEQVVVAAQRACIAHDVTFLATDVDVDGGKILFVAGAPRVGDGDEERMLLALRESVRGHEVLAVRAGASRGRAFAVDVGTDERRTYAVMGDATNLSARVMGKAEVGEVLATTSLLDHVPGRFEVALREPFLVKGKSLPVLAGVVGAPTGRRDLDVHDLPFVGREDELAALDSALASAREGRGRVVVLSGDAGIGKSRLVAELLGRTDGFEVLSLEGGRYAAATPYFAVRAPLRALVGAGHGDDDSTVAARLSAAVERAEPEALPWLPLLGTVLGVDLPDTPEVAALGAEFRATVRHQQAARLLTHALARPTVLLVDDAHWLDDATGDLLGHLVGDVAQRPWLVCVVRRPIEGGWQPDPSVEPVELGLEPLTDDESARLLRAVADERPLVPSARSVLAARAAGNPLFLRELLGAVATGSDGTDLGVLPDTLEEVIGATVDQLDRADRELLRVAAVLGARFEVDTLAAMLDQPSADVARRLARIAHFVAPDGVGRMRFLHGLTRDVAYEGLPFRRRRALHGRAGDALAPMAADHESLVDLLALHFRAAERHPEAWTYARAAAERSRRAAAPVEAARFYGWALAAAGHLPEVSLEDRSDVGEALGDMLELDGAYDAAGRAFAAARRAVSHDRLRCIGLLKKEGWLRERSGRYSNALAWYTRALRQLDGIEGEAAAALHAQLTMAYGAARARQGKYADSLPYLYRAVAEAERLHDEPTLAHTYYLLDWALTDLGRPEAADYREKALPIYERLEDLVGQATVLNNLGIDAYYEGRWDLSRSFLERSRDVCRRSGNVVMDGTALNNIGEILSDQGRYDEAEDVFREALAMWRSLRFPVGLGLCLSNLGRVASRAGRFGDAGEPFAEARRHFTRIGADAFLVELDSREAEALVLRGDGAAALPVLEAAAEHADSLGGVPVALAMLDRLGGLALAQTGDLAGAERRLHLSRGRAADAKADFELALTLHEWSRVVATTDPARSEGMRLSAATILRALGVRSVAEAPLPDPVLVIPTQGTPAQLVH